MPFCVTPCLVPRLSLMSACRETSRVWQARKKTFFDIKSGHKFPIASLWFVHQAAAYPFAKLCGLSL